MARDTTTITISKWVYRKIVNAKLRRSVEKERPLSWDEFFDDIIGNKNEVPTID